MVSPAGLKFPSDVLRDCVTSAVSTLFSGVHHFPIRDFVLFVSRQHLILFGGKTTAFCVCRKVPLFYSKNPSCSSW